jgi:hypothetical protein
LVLVIATLLALVVVLEIGVVLAVEVLLVAPLFEMLWIDTQLLKNLSVLLGIHLSVLTQQPIQDLTCLHVVAAQLAHQIRDRCSVE